MAWKFHLLVSWWKGFSSAYKYPRRNSISKHYILISVNVFQLRQGSACVPMWIATRIMTKHKHLNNSNSATLSDVFITNANTIKCYIANSYRQTKDIWGKRPRFYLSSSRQLGYLSSYRSKGDVVYQFTRMNNVPFSIYLSRLNLIHSPIKSFF